MNQLGAPVRVLHLRDSPWVDGPGRTIIESGRHFDPSRVEYHIGVFVNHADDSHAMADAAKAHSLSVHKIVDRGGLDCGAVERIVSLVDTLGIQVLHTSDLRSRVYGLLVCLRRPQLAPITTVHGWIANTHRRRLMRLLDKMLLRRSKRVIMVSKATRTLVPRWWLPESRVSIVRNALVLDEYGVGSEAAIRFSQEDDATLGVLNVGRLSPEKRQDLLIRAVAILAAECPGLELHIAGVGPGENSLRALARKMGVESRVRFLGYVPDMPGLYAKADVLVQSSATEGLPNVILEAAYLRVPIIATDVGGTSEVVQHGSSAWLIEPGSVEAIVEALRWFISNRGAFALMTARAHGRIRTEFSFDARTRNMTEIYEALLR